MSRNDVSPSLTQPNPVPAPELSTPAGSAPATAETGERLAAWMMRGPLAAALAGLCVFQLATWIPHYLTWPYWADHDVFATLAQGWDDGFLPYRDLRCNNFPGTIYLFWILGKVFGWGRTMPFYAVDAALVVALGGMLLAWSRHRLGGLVPGLVGYLTFLSYYLGLDYSHAAQRDWQGPFFAVVSVLAAQTWSGRAGRLGSALAMALAVSIRPQTVLFFPALVLAIDETSRPPGESALRTVRALAAWSIAFAIMVAAAFAPLLFAGVLGDFVRGVRLTAYGHAYNRVSPASILMGWLTLVAPLRTSLIPLALGLLALKLDAANRRLALVWIAALAFGSLYKPLSPVAHSYLNIPLMLIWSISLAVLVHFVVALARQAPTLQLIATLIILGLGVTARPEFCAFGPTYRALASFRQGTLPEETPPGYRRSSVPTSCAYPWRDYHALIEYLKRETSPDTMLANVLKGDPAITAPAARHSVFPAESLAWLRMLCPEQQQDFADDLARTKNSVVVWIPNEVGPDPNFKIDLLAKVIREHYEPDVRFGTLEVWRRKAGTVARSKPRQGPSGGPEARLAPKNRERSGAS